MRLQSLFILSLLTFSMSQLHASLLRRLQPLSRKSPGSLTSTTARALLGMRSSLVKIPYVFNRKMSSSSRSADSEKKTNAQERTTRYDLTAYGIDGTTLKYIRELEADLKKIKFGCYCVGDKKHEDTLQRQITLRLTSNVIKRLASKTTRKNCNPNSEIYTGKKSK